MNHLKIMLVVLALVAISVLVLFGGSMPILAESPNPAVPTVALPTPVKKPTAGAVSPAKVPTRALVAPTAAKPAAPRVAAARTSAQAFPSYTSSINLQNLSASTASISLQYYNLSDGLSGGSFSDTITASGSKSYFPIPGASTGFNGSAVISSDQPLGSIVNVVGGSFAALDSYVGQGSGTPSVNLPLLMKNNNGIYTWFNVQNAGSSTATVNVTYSDGATAGPTTILAGASKSFSQATETHPVGSKVFGGSVTNTSTNQNLVVAVLTETSTTMSAYTGFGAGSLLPVMPLVNVQPAIHIITGITVFNTGGSSTNVTVSYTPAPAPTGAGAACTETQTISANSNKVFALAAFANGANSTCVAGSKFVGSAQVTVNSASQPLTVMVNQAVPGSSDGAYAGFDPSAATNKVVMPLIMDRNGSAHNIWTSFSLMNVGSGSASVTCSFTGTSYTANTTGGRTLAAGAGFTEFQKNAIASSYVGAGTCTASNASDKIVAVVNQLGEGAAGDQLLVYNAINQ